MSKKKADTELRELINENINACIRYFDADADAIMHEMGERIRMLRKAAGISQIEMANRLDMSNNTMLSIEKGRAVMSSQAIYEYAQIMGVTTDYIYFGDDKLLIDNEVAKILKGKSEEDIKKAVKVLKVLFDMD